MRIARTLGASLVVLAVMLVTAACGSGEPKVDEAREQAWAALLESQAELDGMRAEVVDLKQELEMAAADTVDEGGAEPEDETGEAVASAAEIESQLAAKRTEVQEKADAFMQQVVDYLNAEVMVEGEPPTERQLQVIRMKSAEDMLLAQEYIDRGGDYRRAIDIYNAALMLDPDNEDLEAALAYAEENRYMSEERFATVKKGMTQDDVRELLGQPNLHNVRDYPDREVTAWFYPTAEGGYASGVWFKENKKSGDLEVYQLKYEAVSPEDVRGE